MSAFRSQTDEQLSARHDPEPYSAHDGSRAAHAHGFPTAILTFGVKFDPRPEYIPSRDSAPWAGESEEGAPMRYEDERVGDSIWSPRPEFARPPVNRILTAFRESVEYWGMNEAIRRYLGTFDAIEAGRLFGGPNSGDPSQRAHARKVLARLAAVAS